MQDIYVQIDVKEIKDGFARCCMNAGGRHVTILMQESDYRDLVSDGFFVRSGRSKDSTGILNTTVAYYPERKEQTHTHKEHFELNDDPNFFTAGPDYDY